MSALYKVAREVKGACNITGAVLKQRGSGEGSSWRGIPRRLQGGTWVEEVGNEGNISQKRLDTKTLCPECCGSLRCSLGCSICGRCPWIRLP